MWPFGHQPFGAGKKVDSFAVDEEEAKEPELAPLDKYTT